MIKKFLLEHPLINPFNYSAEKILRVTTSPLRAKPSFLIVGVQKSGTSILFEYISQHPKIKKAYMEKTERFFGKYTEPIKHHSSNYPILKKDEITGDVRQDYSFQPKAAKTLKNILPNVKPIFILRDPVQRTISHYNMNKQANRESLSLEEALQSEDKRIKKEWESLVKNPNHNRRILWNFSYKTKSKYENYIPEWLEFFPDTLILKYEELLKNTQKVISEVFSYLGVSDYTIKVKPYNFTIYENKKLEEFFSVDKELRNAFWKKY